MESPDAITNLNIIISSYQGLFLRYISRHVSRNSYRGLIDNVNLMTRNSNLAHQTANGEIENTLGTSNSPVTTRRRKRRNKHFCKITSRKTRSKRCRSKSVSTMTLSTLRKKYLQPTLLFVKENYRDHHVHTDHTEWACVSYRAGNPEFYWRVLPDLRFLPGSWWLRCIYV